jgi:hypothetical protein
MNNISQNPSGGNINENINRLAKMAKLNHIFGETKKHYIIAVEDVNEIVARIAKFANTNSRNGSNCRQIPRGIKSYSPLFYLIINTLETPLAKVAKVAKTPGIPHKRWGYALIHLAKEYGINLQHHIP